MSTWSPEFDLANIGVRNPRLILLAGASVFGVVMLGLLLMDPGHFGLMLALGVGGLIAAGLGLRSPALATSYLLATTFFRLAIPSGTFPVDPFLPAFVGVLLSTWINAPTQTDRRDGLDSTRSAIALYVLWNLGSIIAPHTYPAGAPLDPDKFSVTRFVLIGIVMPLAIFLVAHRIYAKESDLRQLLWALVGAGAYSAFVSIGQFTGPKALVWPRFIVDSPNWVGRANGVFNQPVVNGLVLIVGFLVSVLVASHRSEPRALRALAVGVAGAIAYAIYLTHTRGVWLSFALVVVCGCLSARGFRRIYLTTAVVIFVGVAVNWSTFTSADRDAGGVASPDEVEDRLNSIATSIWAIKREPITGWGIGRFAAVNTYDHQQWSPAIPWQRGFGISSHLDILGIYTELGIIGLVLWVTALALIVKHVVAAMRQLPPLGVYNRPFAWTALMAIIALVTTGLTVDLRFFDFPNIVVMLLAGAAIGRVQHLRSDSDAVATPVPVEPGADAVDLRRQKERL